MVENETLKKEVDKLTLSLGNAYGGDVSLLKCLGSQRFSYAKERLGYTLKKGKAAFITPKASFVRGNDWFCHSYKQVGHTEQYCKKNMRKVKYIGAPIVGPKKWQFGCPRAWSLTFKDPKIFRYLKRIDFLLKVNYKARGRHWVLDSGYSEHLIRDVRMFNSINSSDNSIESIIFGGNGKGKVRGLGKC